jgi:DNA-directed RNA polymerase subunit H (RpoH/RPB5)
VADRCAKHNYMADLEAQSILSKLVVDSSAVPNFALQDGIIRYKGRIWIGKDPKLRQHIVSASHNSPLGGHSGAPITYTRLKIIFS